MSNYYYDHNTAHILEPVQGYDLVSHMCFTAPLQDDNTYGKAVKDAVPGLVLHRNPTDGKLETGLLPNSMAQFLCSKQDTEDVLQPFVTKNGRNFVGIGTISYGGFNTAPYQGNGYGEGVAANAGWVGAAATDAGGNTYYPVTLNPSTSAFTTFPGACGLELGSSEFADVKDDGVTPVDYSYDEPLTSPTADGSYVYNSGAKKPGTQDQNKQGGFLKPGTNYVDPICGILSQKPFRNENGTRMIRFWAVYQPALSAAAVSANATSLKLGDLSDVDLSVAATADQVLKYDGTSSKWKAAADAT